MLRVRDNQPSYANTRANTANAGAKLLPFPAIKGNGAKRGGNGMLADGASDFQGPGEAAPLGAFRPDWLILRDTILKSVTTSPDAFLATAAQLGAEQSTYWQGRLELATWAVLQRGNEVLGIAAAKPPSETDDYAQQGKACFIESIWIDPSMRRNGFGERLVTYLVEQQRKDGIQQFYLWVFDENAPAIRLYERLEFKRTWRPSQLLDVPEIQFLRNFDSDVVDDDEQERNAAARDRDLRDLGITYRLLTRSPARTQLSRPDWSFGRQAAGSMSRYLKAAMRESRRGRSAR